MALVGDILYRFRGDTSNLEAAQQKADGIVDQSIEKSAALTKALKMVGYIAGGAAAAGMIKFLGATAGLGATVATSIGITGRLLAILSAFGVGMGAVHIATFSLTTALKILATVGVGAALAGITRLIIGQEKFAALTSVVASTVGKAWARIGLAIKSSAGFAWIKEFIHNTHLMEEGIFGLFGRLGKFASSLFAVGTAAGAATAGMNALGATTIAAKFGLIGSAAMGLLSIFSLLVSRFGAFAQAMGEKMLTRMKEFVTMAGEMQRNIWGLNIALEGYIKRVGHTTMSLDDFTGSIKQAALVTGVSMDEMQQGVLTMLDMARVTGLNANQIQSLITRLADFAAVTHTPFLTTVYAADQAMRGFWQSMASLGIQMDRNSIIAAGFGEGLENTKRGIAGAAGATSMLNFLMHETEFVSGKASDAIGKTLPDSVRYFESSIKRLQSSIGAGLVGVWAKFYKVLGDIVNLMNQLPTPVLQGVGAMTTFGGIVGITLGFIVKWGAGIISIIAAYKVLNLVLRTGIPQLKIPELGSVLADIFKVVTRITSVKELFKVLWIEFRAVIAAIGTGMGKFISSAVTGIGRLLWALPLWAKGLILVAGAIAGTIMWIQRQRKQIELNIEAGRKQIESYNAEIAKIKAVKAEMISLAEERKRAGKVVPPEKVGILEEIEPEEIIEKQKKIYQDIKNLAKKAPDIFQPTLEIQPQWKLDEFDARFPIVQKKLKTVQTSIKDISQEMEKYAKTPFPQLYSIHMERQAVIIQRLKIEEEKLLVEQAKLKLGHDLSVGSIVDETASIEALEKASAEYNKRLKEMEEVQRKRYGLKLAAAEDAQAKAFITYYNATKEMGIELEKNGKIQVSTEKKVNSAAAAFERAAEETKKWAEAITELGKETVKTVDKLPQLTPKEILEEKSTRGREMPADYKRTIEWNKILIRELEDSMKTGKALNKEITKTLFGEGKSEEKITAEEKKAKWIDLRRENLGYEKSIEDKRKELRDQGLERTKSAVDIEIKLFQMLNEESKGSMLEFESNLDDLIKSIEDLDWETKRVITKVDRKALKTMLIPFDWTPTDEDKFRAWFAKVAEKLDLDKNPDVKSALVNFRKVFKAGIEPAWDETTKTWKWPKEVQFPKEALKNESLMKLQRAGLEGQKETLRKWVAADYDTASELIQHWTDFYAERKKLETTNEFDQRVIDRRATAVKEIDTLTKLYKAPPKGQEISKPEYEERLVLIEKRKEEDITDIIREQYQDRLGFGRTMRDANLTDAEQEVAHLKDLYEDDLLNAEARIAKGKLSTDEFAKYRLDREKKYLNDLKLLSIQELQLNIDRIERQKTLVEMTPLTRPGEVGGMTAVEKRVNDLKLTYMADYYAEEKKMLADENYTIEEFTMWKGKRTEQYYNDIREFREKDIDSQIQASETTQGVFGQMQDAMRLSMQNFINETPSLARSLYTTYTDMWKGIADAGTDTFTKWIETGRITSKDLASIWGGFSMEVIRSLIRMGINFMVEWVQKLIMSGPAAQTASEITLAAMTKEGAGVVALTNLYWALAIAKKAAGMAGAAGGGEAAGSVLGSGYGAEWAAGPTVASQHGGLVPGEGLGDKVPALLEPKEYVVRKKVVQQIGVNWFDKLNKGVFTIPKVIIQESKQSKKEGKQIPIQKFQQGGLVQRFLTTNNSIVQKYKEGGVVTRILEKGVAVSQHFNTGGLVQRLIERKEKVFGYQQGGLVTAMPMSTTRMGTSSGVSKDDFAKITIVNVFNELDAQKYFNNKKYGDVIVNRAMRQTSKYVKRSGR